VFAVCMRRLISRSGQRYHIATFTHYWRRGRRCGPKRATREIPATKISQRVGPPRIHSFANNLVDHRVFSHQMPVGVLCHIRSSTLQIDAIILPHAHFTVVQVGLAFQMHQDSQYRCLHILAFPGQRQDQAESNLLVAAICLCRTHSSTLQSREPSTHRLQP